MKNKILIISAGLLSLVLLHPMILYSAELSVIIKEKGSGVAVEGATVVLMETEDYETSSSSGLVKFSNVEIAQRIKVIATGYATQEFVTDQDQSPWVFYIEPVRIEGDGMEVTAQRLMEKTSKIALSASELSKSAGGGGDPLQAIVALPGIAQAEEGSLEVYMRGSNGNENITWVNHAPIGYLYHFGGFQSTIHPSLIEDINVFLGSFPVQYGDALGGVLDVKLRAPKNDRMHYQFDISTIMSSFLIEGPVGKAGADSFVIAGRRSYMDLVFSPSDINKLIDDSDPGEILLVPYFYDFQALYRHQLKGGYLDGYVFTAGDELAMKPGSTTKIDPHLAGELREKMAYQTAGITWQQRWNSQWKSITALAYSHHKSEVGGGVDEQGQAIFANTKEKTLHVQPELNWQSQADSQTSMGLSGRYTWTPVDLYTFRAYTENNPDFTFSQQQKYRFKEQLKAAEISPYIRHRQQWTDWLTTQTGLRYTNIGVTGGFRTHKLSPRLTLEYQLSADTLLMTSWGKYIQMPDQLQIIESLGNPSLLMRETEHRIIGVEHKINSRYHIKAEIYQKPMKNLVIALDENDPPDNYANRGTGEAYGFDLFLKRTPSQGKFGWLSLSWAKSNRTNEITGVTRDFSGDQPLTLTGVWGQSFAGSWKRWDASIKALIHSGQPYTAVIGRSREDLNDPDSRWVPEYGKHNAERLPTYYKVDLRIGREVLFNQSKLKFYLDMQNVTFAKNVVAYRYGDDYQNISNPTEVIGFSFFPYAGVEMEF